jgi:two-component system chemotaxis response regulator CheY
MQDAKHVILLIDDDRDFLLGIRTLLESAGYAVAEATSAAEGLQVFSDITPDLVIVDLMMEEMDSGTTLVRELKALRGEVPIYMYSVVGDNLSVTIDPTTLGLEGVLQKPMENERLLEIIATKLG